MFNILYFVFVGSVFAQNNSAVESLQIHPSWFDQPKFASKAVTCDKKRCRCGYEVAKLPLSERHIAGSVNGVGRALHSAWRVYEGQVESYNKALDLTKEKEKERLEKYSCHLRLMQKILMLYYPVYSQEAEISNSETSELVETIKARCKHPNEKGWTQSEAAKEYVHCTYRIRPELSAAAKAKKTARRRFKETLEWAEPLFVSRQERKRMSKH